MACLKEKDRSREVVLDVSHIKDKVSILVLQNRAGREREVLQMLELPLGELRLLLYKLNGGE